MSPAIHCVVCQTPLGDPIYRSPGDVSITSLCAIRQESIEVRFCEHCGHTSTPALADLGAYYHEDYKILIESDEEDQLYAIRDGRKVFRTQHQVETLERKVTLPPRARVLDYGAAKASTLRAWAERHPDMEAHAFDVSDLYLNFWKQFLPLDRFATHEAPRHWLGSFDLVTAFFSLEHAADPLSFLRQVRTLLRPGGVFYAIVPNVFTNTADLVVSDHINHFSRHSLQHLLAATGFRAIEIDDQSHTSAWVVTAVRTDDGISIAMPGTPSVQLKQTITGMGQYWQELGDRVAAFETKTAKKKPAAIYGSGFYGTFLSTCLTDLNNIQCFVDQNPFRQKQKLIEKPILAPESLPQEIEVVYVGLNPVHATAAIESLSCWKTRSLQYFFP